MSESFSSDDDDGFPPPLPNIQYQYQLTDKRNKSVGELLSETIALKNSIQSERKRTNNLEEDSTQDVFHASPVHCIEGSASQQNEFVQVLSHSPKESAVITNTCLFGHIGTLQYFNADGLDLRRCGYYCIPPEKLTNAEKLLLSFSNDELLDCIGEGLKSISIEDVLNLNPIMHYILKVISVHADITTVNCCAQFMKKMLSQHLNVASISFSSAEIFMILFNYGVDVENNKIFLMIPAKKPSKMNHNSLHPLPPHWKSNLRTVLNCLADIFQYCKFNKNDLCNILIYLLCMSVDSTLKASSIYQELQTCLCYVILSFTDKLWPICLSYIPRTLISEGNLHGEQWSYVLDMTRAVPYVIKRGVQLRIRFCYIALFYLSQSVRENIYPDENYFISIVQDILRAIYSTRLKHKDIAVDFLGIFLMHLEYTSDAKHDYNTVCESLKNFESSARSDAHISHLQLKIYRIYSHLMFSPPNHQKDRAPCHTAKFELDWVPANKDYLPN